jgi:hypothetical protein
MSFPKTIDEMTAAGYRHEGTANCKACQAPIEWWHTPNGKKIPMDHGTATPHWSTCPNADDFRRPKVGRSTREALAFLYDGRERFLLMPHRARALYNDE